MSEKELDNGADIGTPLTIYPGDLRALMMMDESARAKVIEIVGRWVLTGKRQGSDDEILESLIDSLINQHSQEVAKHRVNKVKKQESAKARWAKPRIANAMRTQCGRNADAKQTHSECNANGMPIPIPTPITITTSIESESVAHTREEPQEVKEKVKETYPTEEGVLEVASVNKIDEGFALGWLRRMQASNWRDTKGRQIPIRGWRAKLAYAWSDERQRREGNNGRSGSIPSNIHHNNENIPAGVF